MCDGEGGLSPCLPRALCPRRGRDKSLRSRSVRNDENTRGLDLCYTTDETHRFLSYFRFHTCNRTICNRNSGPTSEEKNHLARVGAHRTKHVDPASR